MVHFFYQPSREKVFVLILTSILVSTFIVFEAETMGAYIMLAITFIIGCFVLNQKGIKSIVTLKRFHWSVLLWAMFCFVSSIWARSPSASIEKGTTIVEILICMSIIYAFYSGYENIDNLLLINVLAGVIVSLYSIQHYGFQFMIATASAGNRLGTEFANVNVIAMTCSKAFVIALYFALFKEHILPILLCLPAVIIVAATGSRKAFVMLVAGVVFLLILRESEGNWGKAIAKILLLCVGLCFAIKILENMPLFSTVFKRMDGLFAFITGKGEVDSSSLTREIYILEGIEQWKKTPILGIGMGNSYLFNSGRVYTHNNFVELLSSGGIVGFLIYYSMYFYLLKNIWKMRNTDKKRSRFMLFLIIITLILDYGAVSYYSKGTYFTLMTFFIYVEGLKLQRTKLNI